MWTVRIPLPFYSVLAVSLKPGCKTKNQNMSRAPMFVLESENPLFEFAYDKPHCVPLFAFPPTFRSSTPSAIRRYFP